MGQIEIQDAHQPGANSIPDEILLRPHFLRPAPTHSFLLSRFCTQPFARHPLACVVPSGICLSKFFENTRDKDHHNPTLAPRAFQKISDSNAQWFPLDEL